MGKELNEKELDSINGGTDILAEMKKQIDLYENASWTDKARIERKLKEYIIFAKKNGLYEKLKDSLLYKHLKIVFPKL